MPRSRSASQARWGRARRTASGLKDYGRRSWADLRPDNQVYCGGRTLREASSSVSSATVAEGAGRLCWPAASAACWVLSSSGRRLQQSQRVRRRPRGSASHRSDPCGRITTHGGAGSRPWTVGSPPTSAGKAARHFFHSRCPQGVPETRRHMPTGQRISRRGLRSWSCA